MNLNIKYIILAGMCSVLSSCYYDVQEELHPGGSKVCDTTITTYSAKVRTILSNNCYSCHSQNTASGGIVLDNYSGVKVVADNGRLAGSIDHRPGFAAMPQSQPQLSECDRLTIKKWIENGSANN